MKENKEIVGGIKDRALLDGKCRDKLYVIPGNEINSPVTLAGETLIGLIHNLIRVN